MYRSLATVSADQVRSKRDLDETLGQALGEHLARLASTTSIHAPARTLTQLREQVVSIVHARWVEQDFEAHDAFMREHGYVIRPTDELVAIAFDLQYTFRTGKPWNPNLDPRQAVREAWPTPSDSDTEAAVVLAFPNSPDGVAVAFEQLCPGDHMILPSLGGRLGDDGWYGQKQSGWNFLYRPKGDSLKDRLASGRCVASATVAAVMKFRKGRFFPVFFRFWFDEDTERWYVFQAGAGNTVRGFGGVCF